MIGEKTKTAGKDRRLKLTKYFRIYILIFFVSVIFTQALRSRISNLFFIFVFLLPWVMLLYLSGAWAFLKFQMLSESETIEKNCPYTYKIRLLNESVIPYPFVEARLFLPQKNSVRCSVRSVHMTMSPLADYTVNNTVTFRFRGTYEIGVDCVYVYDFFRIFRLRLDIGTTEKVSVLPRKLILDVSTANAVSDSAKKTQKSLTSYEKIEISDIREYRSGDPLKSIHWKLSSKSEDFLVRDYDTGSSKESFVFCDMSASFPNEAPGKEPPKSDKTDKKVSKNDKNDKKKPRTSPDVREISDEELAEQTKSRAEAIEKGKRRRRAAKAAKENRIELAEAHEKIAEKNVDVAELAEPAFYDDMNEYCADGIVELTVSCVLRELRGGSVCTLVWFDERSPSGVYCFTLRSKDDFDAIFKLFATSPLCGTENSVARLSGMMKDTQDVKQIFVTSSITPEAVRDLCDMPSVADGAVSGAAEVILYDPEERFANPAERKNYIESCRGQLAAKGLRLTVGRLD